MIRLSPKEAARYGLHYRGLSKDHKGSAKTRSYPEADNGMTRLPLTLKLPFPPSTNTAYSTVQGKRVLSKKGRLYHKNVYYTVLFAGTALHLQCRLKVTINLTMPDHRRRDIANYEKVLVDALTLACIWEDDSQIDEMCLHRGEVTPPGCAVVLIEEAK